MMKKALVIVAVIFFGISSNAYAQPVFFTNQDEKTISANNSYRSIIPEKYRTTFLSTDELKFFLWSLPTEEALVNRKNAPILSLPMPDGKMARFHVWEYKMMEPLLAEKFAEIKTFAGQGIDDPYASLRFDYNPYTGFSSQILSINGDVYIDAYARGDINHYISYYSKNNPGQVSFHCSTFTDAAAKEETDRTTVSMCRGPQLFTYRLALSCSGEYATAVCSPASPTIPTAMAAITTTVNRVNGIYEKELAMRFLLVANNSQVIYLNGVTDPFTNGNELVMMNECQATLNSVIGAANYDAGMVLGTGNNSAASFYAICNSPSKGKAVSGLTNPTGDIFDVGRVAHNLGHLFGAVDTHNSGDATCTGGPNIGVEPGGGTTIMSAVGSCGNDNLQPLPDPYFHSTSFDLITGFITGTGAGCHGIINTGNNPPRFTNNVIYGTNIPMNTPFEIRGVTAIDDDNDPVTFSWEEVDRGPTGTWNSALTNGAPAFRSTVPQTTSNRTFPDMQLILAGYPSNPPVIQGGLKGETLSTISRNYNFSLTLRDGRGGVMNAGSNCSSTTFGIHTIYTVPGTGPFKVNLPDGGENWSAGSQQTILWDVAGTTGSINTQFVHILLSADGGLTYPYFLASSVPNDGFEVVTMPNISTTTARVKIVPTNNIYFDISNANFSIAPAPVAFEFSNPVPVTLSCPAPSSVSYLISTISNGGYSAPVNLSATGVPAGATISFGTNPVQPGSSSTVTLNNVNTVQKGVYYITITGTSGSITRTRVLVLNVQSGPLPVITSQAVSQTDCEGSNITFSIVSTSAISYQWQKSTNSGFSFDDITLNGNSSSYTIINAGFEFNNRYRCIVRGQCNSTISDTVRANVIGAPFITGQPQNTSLCAGGSRTISITAQGGTLTWQWQVSTNGGVSFANISGASQSAYTLAGVTTAMNNNQYRCLVLKQGCTTPVASGIATLTVNELPAVSIAASPYLKLLPGLTTTITATANVTALPFTYRWRLGNAFLGGVTGNTYTAGISRLGDYRVDVTDTKGCTGSSPLLTISDSVSSKLFIFPSPNNGEFAVAYYNPGGATVERQVSIYNATGAKILFNKTTVSGPYQLLHYNIKRSSKGLYFVVLSDAAGNILAKGKMLVQ